MSLTTETINGRIAWTWDTILGPTTLCKDELVRLDDGCEGFVDMVVLPSAGSHRYVPRILVVQRKLGDHDMEPGWYMPANVVG